MIGIEVNKTKLQVDPGTKVGLEFNNPIFDDEIIQGDYSLPVNIPYHGNASLFRFNHELLNRERLRSFPDSRLFFKKAPIQKGIFDINSIDKDYINASFRLNISGLKSVTKKLSELDLGGLRDIGSDTATIIASCNTNAATFESQAGTDFCFPMIYNPSFYGSNNPDFEGFINNYDGSSYKDNVTTNRNCLVPMAWLHYILIQGFAEDGYTAKFSGFMSDSNMRKLVIYNNVALDYRQIATTSAGLHASVTNSPVWNSGQNKVVKFDNDSTGPNYDDLTAYDPSSGEYTIQAIGSHIISVHLRAKTSSNTSASSTTTMKLRLYLDSTLLTTVTSNTQGVAFPTIQINGFNFVAAGGDIGKKLYAKLEFYNSVNPSTYITLLGTNYFAVNDFTTTSNINTYRGQFLLNDHVPDITFGDFLSAIKKAFNITYQFNSRTREVTIDFVNEYLSQPFTEFSPKSIHSHKINFNTATIYRSFNWTFAGDDAQEEGNFKYYDPTLYLGSFTSWYYLNYYIPPSASVVSKYAYIENINQIFKCNDLGGSVFKWEYYTDAYRDRVINESGTVDVRPAVSPLLMKQFYNSYNPGTYENYWFAPSIDQQGSSTEFELGPHDYSFKILMYHGLSMHDGFTVYPFSSTSTLSQLGSLFHGFNLNWEDYGCYQFWERFVDLLINGEFIEKRIKLTLPDLMTFDINAKLRVDQANFLIKQMRIELGDEMDEAIFTLLKTKS